MARLEYQKWNPQQPTLKAITGNDKKRAYKALRNSSDAFIKKQAVRDAVFSLAENKCVQCGSIYDLQVDHIASIYSAIYGDFNYQMVNDISNLQALCGICNASKKP